MIWIGTSGYNYPEWKGSFYPSDLAAAKMLPYYAARFPTVEINYTFYRMPNEKLVGGWAAWLPRGAQAWGVLLVGLVLVALNAFALLRVLVPGFARVA